MLSYSARVLKYANCARQRRIDVQVLDVVEERVERIEVPLRYRIVLVVMALRAIHREPEPRCRHGVGAVECFLEARLLVSRAALAVAQRVAMETGVREEVGRRILEQVGGELQSGELVEGHVFVQRLDHPVAGRLLAVVLRIRQPVDQAFMSAGEGVVEEFLCLFL